MTFPGMDHLETRRAPSYEKVLIRLDRPPQTRDIVAEHFPETAGLKKISLHVDYQKSGLSRVKLVNVRLSLDAYRAAQVHSAGDVWGSFKMKTVRECEDRQRTNRYRGYSITDATLNENV